MFLLNPNFSPKTCFGIILTQNSCNFRTPDEQKRPKGHLRDTPDFSKGSQGPPKDHQKPRKSSLRDPRRSLRSPKYSQDYPPSSTNPQKAPQDTPKTPQYPSLHTLFSLQSLQSSQSFLPVQSSSAAILQPSSHLNWGRRNARSV